MSCFHARCQQTSHMRRTRRSLAPWILGLFQVQGFASVGLLGLRSARNRACRCLVVLFAGACRAVGALASIFFRAVYGLNYAFFYGTAQVCFFRTAYICSKDWWAWLGIVRRIPAWLMAGREVRSTLETVCILPATPLLCTLK